MSYIICDIMCDIMYYLLCVIYVSHVMLCHISHMSCISCITCYVSHVISHVCHVISHHLSYVMSQCLSCQKSCLTYYIMSYITYHVSPCLTFYAMSHISPCLTCQVMSHILSCLTCQVMSHMSCLMSYLNDRYMLTEPTGSKESWIADYCHVSGDSIDRKSRWKFIQMLKNSQIIHTFWWKIRPTLGPSISGTKCDKDKPIFFYRKRGSFCDGAFNKAPIRS